MAAGLVSAPPSWDWDDAKDAALAQEPTCQDLGKLTDEQLLEAIRAGSELHFSELYTRYFPRVYAFTAARLRSREDAEEVVQDVFTVVSRSLPAFRGDSQLLTWIFGIARNTVNNHVRRMRNANERFACVTAEDVHPVDAFATCTPEEQLTLQRCVGAIEDKLGDVSQWQADVFKLRHEENLPIREIAQRTQRSGDSVRSSLYRVKRLLIDAVDAQRADVPARPESWSAA